MPRPIITLKKKQADAPTQTPKKADKPTNKNKPTPAKPTEEQLRALILEKMQALCPVFKKQQLLAIDVHKQIGAITKFPRKLIHNFLKEYVKQEWYLELQKQGADRFDVLGKNAGQQEKEIAAALARRKDWVARRVKKSSGGAGISQGDNSLCKENSPNTKESCL